MVEAVRNCLQRLENKIHATYWLRVTVQQKGRDGGVSVRILRVRDMNAGNATVKADLV